MDLLGNTLRKIATEKAGIIKKSVPVVISETQSEVRSIFVSRAEESGSVISFADERFSCCLLGNDNLSGERRYTVTDLLTHRRFQGTTVLCGDYQSGNIQAVFCSILKLQSVFSVTDRNISDGIMNVVRNTGLAGRWQILNLKPLTICDTAHNREGLEFVLEQIRMIPKSKLHIILGFVNDKDLNSVLPLFPDEAKYYFTKASVPRAMNEEILKAESARFGLAGDSFPDVKTALDHAMASAGISDLIFIGGSTFIVADIIGSELFSRIRDRKQISG
jgi:dihydrofolate synthase/folylpolyglutamate synthase